MLTNNEIVEKVYKYYNLHKTIIRMVYNSDVDNSCYDLGQHIYLTILEMDNKKLNDIYINKKLRVYIWNIIRNQRNIIYSDYRKTKFQDREEIIDNLYDDEKEEDERLDFLDSEFQKYNFMKTGMTQQELKITCCYEMLKLKVKKDYTIKQLSNMFNCSQSQIKIMINFAKNKLKDRYDRYIIINDV